MVKQKLIKFSGLFYRLRKFLSKSQMTQVFKSYVQPVVQYGILIYGISVLSDISLIDSKLKKIRIIFIERTFNSVSDLRRKFNLFLAKELHLYEVLKLLIKMLGDECVVTHVKSFLSDNELNRVNKRTKTTMCLDCGDRKNVKNRLRFKVQKKLNLLVFLEPSFVNTVFKMTNQQIKHFCHLFLRNYIINNQGF